MLETRPASQRVLFVCGTSGGRRVVLYRFPPEDAPGALPLPPKVTAFCTADESAGGALGSFTCNVLSASGTRLFLSVVTPPAGNGPPSGEGPQSLALLSTAPCILDAQRCLRALSKLYRSDAAARASLPLPQRQRSHPSLREGGGGRLAAATGIGRAGGEGERPPRPDDWRERRRARRQQHVTRVFPDERGDATGGGSNDGGGDSGGGGGGGGGGDVSVSAIVSAETRVRRTLRRQRSDGGVGCAPAVSLHRWLEAPYPGPLRVVLR